MRHTRDRLLSPGVRDGCGQASDGVGSMPVLFLVRGVVDAATQHAAEEEALFLIDLLPKKEQARYFTTKGKA